MAGWVGRDAWKSNDIAAFGTMQAMAQGDTNWWTPLVLGMPADVTAWLPYWLGAACMVALPSHPELASRLPFAVALLATLYLTWQAVYHFASASSAQPVAFAFGGQASSGDYARALADAGALALMACLGLAQLSHEATPHLFQAMAVAGLLLAAAMAVRPEVSPTRAHAIAMLAAVTLGLSGQAPLALALLGVQAVTIYRVRAAGMLRTPTTPTASAPEQPTPAAMLATGLASAFVMMALLWLAGLSNLPWQSPWPESLPSAWSLVKLVSWFTWPAWPLACWALWRWRRHWHQPHLALPLVFVGTSLFNGLLQPDTQRLFMLSLPAWSVLAAFAMPTMRRSMSALIDWFSLLFFSTCALVIWVVWVAMQTGTPAKPAANVARLAPDFVPEFQAWPFAMATIATACWLAAVAWRMGRHPPYLWKSLVLPAGGSVLCWLLLMTLWLPLLDHGRSYRVLALRAAEHIGPGHCAYAPNLTLAQVVGLTHLGNVDLERQPNARPCDFLLTTNQAAFHETGLDGSQWSILQQLNRLNDRQESLLLYARINTQPAPLFEAGPDFGTEPPAEPDPQAATN